MTHITGKQEILSELEKRVNDNILERNNFDLLKKLVENADTLDEAIKIAELGTTYKRTGFHFDKRLERHSDTISYFKKNEKLSFVTDPKALTHKLIIGDNYPALLNLLIEYKGNVDVIYIDPPYGKDSMGTFAQTNYDNALARDNLLSMLYPRLWLAKQLLSETGVIFCSIDDKNQAYVKCLFDEVFGENNFVGSLIWRKKSGGGQTDKFFVTEHEYVLVYSKTDAFEWLDDVIDNSANGVSGQDENGKYRLVKLEKWGTAARRQDRPTMYYPIKKPDGKNFFPVAPDGNEGRWRIGKTRMDSLVRDNGIEWKEMKGKWVPYEKVYFTGNEVKVLKSRSVLFDVGETGDGSNLLTHIFGKKDMFSNPKPVELIKELLTHCANAIVLDFFSGSGTTGQAVLELNKEDHGSRQFILVTNNENNIALDVTCKRLKRVVTGQCYDGTSDFDWVKKHQPLGDNLEVLDIAEVANFEAVEGKTPFDVIDETLYGQKKFKTVKQKVEWVCDNFEGTQKRLEEK